MEPELNWPDDKEVQDPLDDDSNTERNTDVGDGENIKTDIDKDGSPPRQTTAATTPATSLTMDDYFFQHFVRSCRNVTETTSYLEIFNYSVC